MVYTPTKVVRKVFKRLETDAEFLIRIIERSVWAKVYAKDLVGDSLDHYAEWNFQMQRRIVEATA